jgi:anti-sigma regulatory factor (Ser/Thr protein kinase)
VPRELPVAVALIGPNGSVGHWNRTAALLFGADRADGVGRPALDSVTLADTPEGLRGVLRGTAVTPLSGRCSSGAGAPLAWWAYPLAEPWTGVALVVADLGPLQAAGTSVAAASPGFAGVAGIAVRDPARMLAAMLPRMSPRNSHLLTGQLLSAGYPVLDVTTRLTLAPVPHSGPSALPLRDTADHHEQRLATTLQEAMLPQGPGKFPGIEIAARYLPGTLLGTVGGDWYDTIKLPGGRVALVVGDVMGHGINSAAMMGQLRIAIQTLACLDLPPGVVLRKLDDLAQRLGDHYLATCLYVVYDPVAQVCQLANAGHVPPVLVTPDGRGELLGLPSGGPIGIGGVPFETVFVPVAAGTHLLMYTDGLVGRRGRDIGEGFAALCERVRIPAAGLGEACDAVLRAAAAGDRADDIALLMARLHGIPRDAVATWKLPLDPREARHARQLTAQTLRAWGLGELADVAELLVSEVVTNALRHSQRRPITLRLMNAGAFLCEVTDDSHEMPALIRSGPDRETGRGLWLVSRLARSWATSRTAAGKTVWFEMALPGADPSGE